MMTTEWCLNLAKTQPINYSRGRKGQSLAWNRARSYQSAGAGEGDICLWDSLALSNSPAFQSLLVSPSPSAHSLPVIEASPFFPQYLSFLISATLSLDILCLSLCERPATARTLFHGSPSPLFTHSLTSSLFHMALILPTTPSFLPLSLCLELLVVLRTLAPSPSAAICLGLAALQLAGLDKALMHSPSSRVPIGSEWPCTNRRRRQSNDTKPAGFRRQEDARRQQTSTKPSPNSTVPEV